MFVDGQAGAIIGDVVERHGPIGAMGNWTLGMWELYIRDSDAELYIMFQDDILAVPNLRRFLEQLYYPPTGYLNLMTMVCNEPADRGLPASTRGWYLSDQRGMGAQALVFSNDMLRVLFSCKEFIEKPKHARKPDRNIDGCISDAMKTAGVQEWVHYPSLVQHIGRESAIGNAWKGSAPSFKEDYDPCLATG